MTIRLALLLVVLAFAGLWGTTSQAAELRYGLTPQQVAPGCYAVLGGNDYFSFENGGNVVNVGIIVTTAGSIVIDTGPSKRYGEELRAAIEALPGGKPILRVINTHIHPDHFLGNQAFSDVPLESGQVTHQDIMALGQDFTLNMYRLNGDWMRGTEPLAPNTPLLEGVMEIGGHRLRILRFDGHSREDFVVLDETCGVLYAADLVFSGRTPTFPHAQPEAWIAALDRLAELPFSVIVPGHGTITDDRQPLSETRNYVMWLKALLEASVRSGLDITEVMELPIPERFLKLSEARAEFQRTVSYLYPAIEAQYLPELTK